MRKGKMDIKWKEVMNMEITRKIQILIVGEQGNVVMW